MNTYTHDVYRLTKNFPKEELYGVTSQLRRAALSVILNYIEGYARMRDKVHINFLEVSFGSLKESQYLIEFSTTEKYLSQVESTKVIKLGDEIAAMLWGVLRKLK